VIILRFALRDSGGLGIGWLVVVAWKERELALLLREGGWGWGMGWGLLLTCAEGSGGKGATPAVFQRTVKKKE